MERKVDETEETTSEEEEEVSGTSACSQHKENVGITDSTTCPSLKGNQGAIPLVASDADSSAVSDVDEPFGIGMQSLESDPFLCSSRMSISYNEDTISTTESLGHEPGTVSSHLFETASFQLLPEAQLNLSLDNKNPPNDADFSSPGESTSSAPSSQLLPQTQDCNSLVVSNDQSGRRRPTSSIASAVKYFNDLSSELLPHTQDSNSLVVSGGQSRRHRPTSSISRAVSSPCDIPDCRLTYKEAHNFDSHIRKDERGVYYCMWRNCDRSFRRLDNVYNHLCTHSAKNSFNCYLGSCNMRFTNVSAFCRHCKLHSGERPYVCGKCGAAFERSENLDAHEVTHDSDSE